MLCLQQQYRSAYNSRTALIIKIRDTRFQERRAEVLGSINRDNGDSVVRTAHRYFYKNEGDSLWSRIGNPASDEPSCFFASGPALVVCAAFRMDHGTKPCIHGWSLINLQGARYPPAVPSSPGARPFSGHPRSQSPPWLLLLMRAGDRQAREQGGCSSGRTQHVMKRYDFPPLFPYPK